MNDVYSQVWGEFHGRNSASRATTTTDNLIEKGIPVESTKQLAGRQGNKTYVNVRVSSKEKEEQVKEWLKNSGADNVWSEPAQSIGIF